MLWIVAVVALGVACRAATPAAFYPGKPMYDTDGNQIDAHGGGFLSVNGTFYWYGSARKNHPDPPGLDKGINLYSSSDLYTWTYRGLVVSPIPSNRSTNGLDLERPKVIECGGKFVMWLRGTPIYNGTLLKVGVLTSPSPTGPWTWVNGGPNGDPFRTLGPMHWQYGDATLWTDRSTGLSYVYWRARTQDAGFRAMQLNSDCTSVVESTDTQLFTSPNREAPAFFSYGEWYYLWTSGTLGWTPVQAYAYKGPTPLGPFNSTLGHGWHAYMKSADWNSTQKFSVRDGYLSAGHDWIPSESVSFSAAMKKCANSGTCRGFTFKAYDRMPPSEQIIKCSYKSVVEFVPEGDPEGLQPPPIPEPGDPGNSKSGGQPGEYSYGSQSTYILPNPAWTPGSKLAQFVYMADRWEPSTPNFGVYVWLPLFVDDQDASRVSVPWYDAWRLDNVTSPFV